MKWLVECYSFLTILGLVRKAYEREFFFFFENILKILEELWTSEGIFHNIYLKRHEKLPLNTQLGSNK